MITRSSGTMDSTSGSVADAGSSTGTATRASSSRKASAPTDAPAKRTRKTKADAGQAARGQDGVALGSGEGTKASRAVRRTASTKTVASTTDRSKSRGAPKRSSRTTRAAAAQVETDEEPPRKKARKSDETKEPAGDKGKRSLHRKHSSVTEMSIQTTPAVPPTQPSQEASLKEWEMSLMSQQQTLDDMFELATEQRTQEIMKRLDNTFTCALCVDVIACPYTLTGPGCGHTYCATCILQWAFDSITQPPLPQQNVQLECPLCRAELPLFLTQNAPFPFVPARLVDEMLSDLLGQLAQMSNESKSGGAVSGWGQGGAAKLDWLKRDKVGRERMAILSARWGKLTYPDFHNLRATIG